MNSPNIQDANIPPKIPTPNPTISNNFYAPFQDSFLYSHQPQVYLPPLGVFSGVSCCGTPAHSSPGCPMNPRNTLSALMSAIDDPNQAKNDKISPKDGKIPTKISDVQEKKDDFGSLEALVETSTIHHSLNKDKSHMLSIPTPQYPDLTISPETARILSPYLSLPSSPSMMIPMIFSPGPSPSTYLSGSPIPKIFASQHVQPKQPSPIPQPRNLTPDIDMSKDISKRTLPPKKDISRQFSPTKNQTTITTPKRKRKASAQLSIGSHTMEKRRRANCALCLTLTKNQHRSSTLWWCDRCNKAFHRKCFYELHNILDELDGRDRDLVGNQLILKATGGGYITSPVKKSNLKKMRMASDPNSSSSSTDSSPSSPDSDPNLYKIHRHHLSSFASMMEEIEAERKENGSDEMHKMATRSSARQNSD